MRRDPLVSVTRFLHDPAARRALQEHVLVPAPARADAQATLRVVVEELNAANARLERTVAELQEARLFADAIVDTLRDPLLVLDADLRVVSANRALYRTLALAPDETIGRSLRELHDGALDDPTLEASLGAVLSDRRALNDFEIERDVPTIGRRILLLSARILRRGDDRPEVILVTIEDVTERRRGELVRRQPDAIGTIERLAASLAHELNQPLTAIANEVEACATYVRSGKRESRRLLSLLERAGDEALRAGEIVHHLRESVQRHEPRFESVDLCDVVRDAASRLSRELERAAIVLRLDLPPDGLPIRADRIQIEQVLGNIVQNAIDAIRDAEGESKEIRVTTARVEGGMTEVRVDDTGTGLAASVTARLYEPFVTTKPHGMGMGLAISRTIVEQHGGRLSVGPRESGCGTSARVILPVDSGAAARST